MLPVVCRSTAARSAEGADPLVNSELVRLAPFPLSRWCLVSRSRSSVCCGGLGVAGPVQLGCDVYQNSMGPSGSEFGPHAWDRRGAQVLGAVCLLEALAHRPERDAATGYEACPVRDHAADILCMLPRATAALNGITMHRVKRIEQCE